MDRIFVKVLPDGLKLEATRDTTLLSVLRAAGIKVRSDCGGLGVCGKCRVLVRAGWVSEVSERELRHLGDSIREGYRLACQLKLEGDVVVVVPDESRVEGKEKLVVLGVEPSVELSPAVLKIRVKLNPPTLESPLSDDYNLLSKLRELGFEAERISYGALKKLPEKLRECSWDIYVVLYDNEVLDVECISRNGGIYGFAVDVGTTKVAGFLVDLSSGSVVYAAGEINPQVVYGEDVMSRITHAILNPNGLADLQRSIVNCVNSLIEKACSESRVDPSRVYEVVVVGNTAMLHLFLGIEPRYLGLSPYVPSLGLEHAVKANNLGLRVNEESYVYIPPSVAGFVGADFLADLLVVKLLDEYETALILDIGTNAEIGLIHRNTILACSAAAGPALEGGHIKHGMKSSQGAIERVFINPCTLEPSWKTIGGTPPKGICGSGVVDAVSEMLKVGIIDKRGKMLNIYHPRVRRGPDGLEYVLAWRDETASKQWDIVVTQRDISEVQKAKAAIQAGWRVLLSALNLTENDLDAVFVAGAFGNYINPESAVTIGLLPEVPASKVVFLGNSAGSGARILLKSREARGMLKELRGKVKYVELAAHSLFTKEFIASLYLPYVDASKYPKTVEKISMAKGACREAGGGS